MNGKLDTSVFFKLLVISIFAVACGTRQAHRTMAYVFTLAPAESVTADMILDGTYRYAPDMKIAVIEDGKASDALQVITANFHSARAPEVSFDGKSIIFSGQKNDGDAWQIWLYDMKKQSFSQVTKGEANCTDPTWLPDGRIAYSKLINEEGLEHHAIFYIQPDGCCEQRITFQPHEDLNPMTLHDGRILFSSRQLYPEKGVIKYLAMRPDGTKAELFCQPATDALLAGKAAETTGRKVVFTEDGRLVSVSFNRPLHTRVQIHEKTGIFQSAQPLEDNLLVSVSHEKTGIFGLNVIDKAGETLYQLSDPSNHMIEAMAVTERPVPKKLPTRVDPKKSSGVFVCLDTDASDINIDSDKKTSKVTIHTPTATIGEVNVAGDGSFNIELPSDTPLQFTTYDDEGNVLRGPSAWMWVRPGEHRGCVGCHEDREISPENRVPESLNNGPVSFVSKESSNEKSHE